VDLRKFAFGVSGGYGYFLILPKNFFLLVAITPGIGINFKMIETETINYKPNDFLELSIYANIILGYNRPKYYIEAGAENTWAYSSLDNGNSGSMNSTKFKLAFGWKLRRADN